MIGKIDHGPSGEKEQYDCFHRMKQVSMGFIIMEMALGFNQQSRGKRLRDEMNVIIAGQAAENLRLSRSRRDWTAGTAAIKQPMSLPATVF